MLICLSASHKNADFETLEQLSRATNGMAEDLVDAYPFIAGSVVVSTCNRVEVYVDVDEPITAAVPITAEAVVTRMQRDSGLSLESLYNAFETFHGIHVADHLFRVTSGLESMVVGEDEISGQVRKALDISHEAAITTPDLERMFQRATQTARGVKNQAGIGAAGRSIVRLALKLAESRIANWGTVRVLMFGTGQYARTTVAALRDLGVMDISVYSPSNRAKSFTDPRGLLAVQSDELMTALTHADVIICCTLANGYALDADMLNQARQQGRSQLDSVRAENEGSMHLAPPVQPDAQLVIDLGLPRNVNPNVVQVPGVELLDLETVKLHAPLDEREATERAQQLIGRAVRKFEHVTQENSLNPAMVALREHFLSALDAELERVKQRGGDTETTERAMRHLVGVLLHEPMVNARQLARAGDAERYVDALEALFSIQTQIDKTATSADSTTLGGKTTTLGLAFEA